VFKKHAHAHKWNSAWVVEDDRTIEMRLEMMKNHKAAVLDKISLMTESLKGIDEKITRYTKRIQERKENK
jgi:hypothetical protein